MGLCSQFLQHEIEKKSDFFGFDMFFLHKEIRFRCGERKT